MLAKKKDIFFETLLLITENIKDAAVLFKNDMENPSDLEGYAEKIKMLEHKGDEYTHVIFQALNRTFITPLERDDIMALTGRLDDILDAIEACADLISIYNLNNRDSYLCLYARMIERCAVELQKALRHLIEKKYSQIHRHIVWVNSLENEADQLYRECLKDLFSTETDVKKIIQRKEVYELIEGAFDRAEDAADILEGIVMRS